jgi:hypothetical protein
MPRGNPGTKLAISMTQQMRDMVAASAVGEGVSVSAWIGEAIRRRLVVEAGLAAVAEFELEEGAFTPEEIAEARRQILAEDEAARKARGPKSA